MASLSLQPDGPVDWLGFAVWLSMLLHAHGQEVLRVKGLVELDEGTLVSVNGVQHVVHKPEHLDRSIDLGPVAGIVFITRGIEIERLRESFDAFQRLARIHGQPAPHQMSGDRLPSVSVLRPRRHDRVYRRGRRGDPAR